jgi:hypothetical protein
LVEVVERVTDLPVEIADPTEFKFSYTLRVG